MAHQAGPKRAGLWDGCEPGNVRVRTLKSYLEIG